VSFSRIRSYIRVHLRFKGTSEFIFGFKGYIRVHLCSSVVSIGHPFRRNENAALYPPVYVQSAQRLLHVGRTRQLIQHRFAPA